MATRKPTKESPPFFLIGSGLIVILFLLFTIWGSDGLLRLWELRDLRNQIVTENKDLLLQNLTHIQEIRQLKSARYVEQVARSELGMIRDDEVILVVKE